jgi:hypothetical protein
MTATHVVVAICALIVVSSFATWAYTAIKDRQREEKRKYVLGPGRHSDNH